MKPPKLTARRRKPLQQLFRPLLVPIAPIVLTAPEELFSGRLPIDVKAAWFGQRGPALHLVGAQQ